MAKFHENIGVQSMHQVLNGMPPNVMDKTFVGRLKAIDAVPTSSGAIEQTERCKLFENDEIVDSD